LKLGAVLLISSPSDGRFQVLHSGSRMSVVKAYTGDAISSASAMSCWSQWKLPKGSRCRAVAEATASEPTSPVDASRLARIELSEGGCHRGGSGGFFRSFTGCSPLSPLPASSSSPAAADGSAGLSGALSGALSVRASGSVVA
jgi:hypothetical protein